MPSLLVRAPGLLTTVQDLGRWGWQHVGVPVGGAMDVVACRRANRLVGNPPGAAVLEATVRGPTLEADADLTVALTGGPFAALLDDRSIPFGTPIHVPARSVLILGDRRGRARCWMAVAGGLDVPVVLGSRATTPGVLGGRPLRSGDVLPIGPALRGSDGPQDWPVLAQPAAPRSVPVLRVLPGPDVALLGAGVLDVLCGAPFVVGPQSNRMGFRLEGPTLRAGSHSLPSSGTVMGMLQVPPSGQPILLMADRQTTGGYPVAAVVIEADLPVAAGLAPGDACGFRVCTRREAVAARLRLEREWLDG